MEMCEKLKWQGC